MRLNFNGHTMQFSRYLYMQHLRTTFGVTLVIVGIVWLFQTIRLLELVINRGAAFLDFVLMSLAVVPLWITIALPIGAFIAANWVFHRILADRELTVMQAIGQSPFQIGRAAIYAGFTVSVLLVINSVFILPTSFSIYKELQFKIRNNIPAIMLQENVFIDIVDGMTILIGEHEGNGVARDVFIHDTRNPTRIVTVTAESGKFTTSDGLPALVLYNGQRAEMTETPDNAAMLMFESHTMAINASGNNKAERMPIDMNEDSITNLLDPEKSPNKAYYNERRVEGHYRIASPLLALALVLMTTSIMLFGQIRRDLWLRRALLNIGLGIGLIVFLITSRSISVTAAQFIPLIYVSVGAPILLSLWSLLRNGHLPTPMADEHIGVNA